MSLVISPKLCVSASISGTNQFLSLPCVPSLTSSYSAQDGLGRFDVSTYDRFSYQCYLSGTNVTGTLALQVSNNAAGWVGVTGLSQSINTTGYNGDVVFAVQQNVSPYCRVMFSGTAGLSSSVSISFAGHGSR